jgi:hypothetical protein
VNKTGHNTGYIRVHVKFIFNKGTNDIFAPLKQSHLYSLVVLTVIVPSY